MTNRKAGVKHECRVRGCYFDHARNSDYCVAHRNAITSRLHKAGKRKAKQQESKP